MIRVYLKKFPGLKPNSPIFKSALDYIGIKGYFKNDDLIIQDADQLIKAFKLLQA